MTQNHDDMDRIKDKTPLMSEGVYESISSYILTQGLAPGDKLTVDNLAKMLDVSQTPVRQALTRLLANGLVTNQRNSGFRIAPLPSRKQLCDALAVRGAIETAYVEVAVKNADDETLTQLKAALDIMAGLLEADRVSCKVLLDADVKFHVAMANAGDNAVASKVISDLMQRNSVYRLTYYPQMPQEVFAEHKAIYDAFVAGSSSAAKDLLTKHLMNWKTRVGHAMDGH